jgi:hypothetical protein
MAAWVLRAWAQDKRFLQGGKRHGHRIAQRVTGWQDDYGFLINQRPDRKNVVIALSPVGGRMIDAVRTLAADREQLLTRMASLERSLAEVTGSIKRDVNAASQLPLPQIISTPSVAGAPAADAPASPPEMPPAAVAAAANVPASTLASSPPSAIQAVDLAAPDLSGRGAAAASNPVRNAQPTEPATAELGVDVGGALNFDSLLTLWSSIKHSNGHQASRARCRSI